MGYFERYRFSVFKALFIYRPDFCFPPFLLYFIILSVGARLFFFVLEPFRKKTFALEGSSVSLKSLVVNALVRTFDSKTARTAVFMWLPLIIRRYRVFRSMIHIRLTSIGRSSSDSCNFKLAISSAYVKAL